jgi:LPXTG-site transpeptidase (sortase) family protein
MASRVPETGSAALTYDKSADIGVFDGRIVAPKRATRGVAAPVPATAPARTTKKPAPAEARPVEPVSEPLVSRHKGVLLPLLAGLALVLFGGGAVIYSLFTVVTSDQAAARAQDDLRTQFASRQSLADRGLLAEAFDPDAIETEVEAVAETDFGTGDDIPVIFGTPTGSAPVVNDPTSLPGWLFEAPPENGEALGRIVIPTASIDWVVVQGVNPNHLTKGPGHMPGTVMPGQYGNAVISGHRTTYGGPFGNLDRMAPGDQFTVETLIVVHTYQVVSVELVRPTDTWVVQPMDGAWLTLITCHPKYTSQQRMIVFSKLIDGPNADAVTDVYGTAYPAPRQPLPFESTPTPAG